ncbi:MAG TPA: murein L,D-transpeptidase catalytic domain family protein [Gemmatimonadaceae bacterium]|nr:murein L,D-transpeptidase catalytic domain family protein [Gemmatimonadaceae bacterium]
MLRAPYVPDSVATASIAAAARGTGLRLSVLRSALAGYSKAVAAGAVQRALLTVIDYSLPSHVRRLWVLDLEHGKVLAREFVAHGRGSGADSAYRFSNRPNSYASSLGTFVTENTYQGANGLSLRLDGLDAGLNDHALDRGIVMHGAWYVSQQMIAQYGRLGRSEGCPALSERAARKVIPMIADGSVLYAYYPTLAKGRGGGA